MIENLKMEEIYFNYGSMGRVINGRRKKTETIRNTIKSIKI